MNQSFVLYWCCVPFVLLGDSANSLKTESEQALAHIHIASNRKVPVAALTLGDDGEGCSPEIYVCMYMYIYT